MKDNTKGTFIWALRINDQGLLLDMMEEYKVMDYIIKNGIHLNKNEEKNEFQIYEQVLGEVLEKKEGVKNESKS